LDDLAAVIGFSPQRISDIERAKATPSRQFITACEDALHADGKLLLLLPDAQRERDTRRQERADARRAARQAKAAPALPCEAPHSKAGDDDQAVEPTDRRGLLEAGAAAALGIPLLAAPTQARAVDPELPAHSARLLDQLGRLDAALGPQDLLQTVRYEVGRIVAHRKSARGELHTDLLRVEAQWAGFAAWLCSDTGQTRDRDAWAERALRLAREVSYSDMIAFVRSRQSQWALQELDARRATRLVEDTHSRGSAQSRALCASYAALGHALAGDAAACERSLADARSLAERSDSPAPPWAGGFRLGDVYLLTTEARCWLWLEPSKAIPLYEGVLRGWPRNSTRTGGLHQARLALACAASGELDRARAEGGKAFAIFKTTQSTTTARELRRLREQLAAA
jgi:transcriptional regulator with XRE-family HTH domain